MHICNNHLHGQIRIQKLILSIKQQKKFHSNNETQSNKKVWEHQELMAFNLLK